MAEEIGDILKDTAKKIRDLVSNAATMTVETWYIEVGVDQVPVDNKGKANFRQNAHPVAMTEVRFDGDSVGILPVRKASGVLVADSELKALHDHNVKAATDYRAGILNAVVSIFKEAI